MRIASIYLALIIFITSCGASKTSNSTQGGEAKYKSIATEKLGDDLTYKMNDSKTYVLCVSEVEGTVKQPRNMLSYMVIKVSDGSIVLEKKSDGATVKWANDTEIEVYLTPGIMRDDQTNDDFTTIYNVETGKSRKKATSEQD